jgi:hypothetical protein
LLAVAGATTFQVPATASAKFGDRPLERGDEGRHVRVLQRWLTLVGFETTVDGAYGRRTEQAVRRYERQFRMHVDGRISRLQARGLRKRAYRAFAERARLQQQQAASTATTAGEQAVLSADGRTAIAPASAPPQVKAAIAAANEITNKPYRYGGGHGRFRDSGYDCSGAVSYVLHGAGLLERPMDSSELMRFGDEGEGAWISVYAHSGHAYVVIAGLRFDTSGRGESGPRWRPEPRAGRGYTVRHPAGL